MAQHTDDLDGQVRDRHSSAPAVPFWRRPWLLPLAVVSISYLIYQLRPFDNLEESKAPLPPHAGFPLYYPLLIVHILCGTTAMVTVFLQVWPWLRRHHPRIHRYTGRLYVAAALPGGILGLILVRFAPPVGQIGVSMATVAWLATTTTGFVMARRRRFALHRKFMLYSFAIVMNNVWGVVIVNIGLRLPMHISIDYLLEAARWVGWVLNLMLVQAWLDYSANRRRRPRGTGRSLGGAGLVDSQDNAAPAGAANHLSLEVGT